MLFRSHDELEALPGARIFDKGARPMRGWLMVAPEGFADDADFDAWVARGVGYAETLPRK